MIKDKVNVIKNNNLVNKFIIIIVLILIFILLMYIGTSMIIYLNSPKKNPYLIKGMISGSRQKTILQDPKKKDSKTILRSVNEDGGLEFTWGVWLYVNSPIDDNSRFKGFKHIFHKGNITRKYNDDDKKGIFMPNNAPGLYFKYNKNDESYSVDDKTLSLYIFMNTYKRILEEVVINEIPIEKWFHIAIRVKQKVMDVFINGQIIKRKIFSSIPKQNYDNVHIAKNGGFDGNISDLRYFNSALSGSNILTIINNGPDLRSNNKKKAMDYYPPYFSLNWFFNN